jgi:phage head maturation protease
MANVAFPDPGISAVSDQVRAMVAAGVLRGASVGFLPGQFKFSKDPARPLGIDFLSGHTLTEWSLCAVPCNPSCLVVGPTASGKSASDVKITDRRRAARQLTARARSIFASTPNPVPMTRAQRIAEAQALRRMVMAGEK